MKKLKTTFITLILLSSFLVILTPTTSLEIRTKPPSPPGKSKVPKVNIFTSDGGSTVSGLVLITVSATDKEDGPLIADIYIDGIFIIHANSYNWDTISYVDGLHILEAVAYDTTGKSGSDTITVTTTSSPLLGFLGLNLTLFNSGSSPSLK